MPPTGRCWRRCITFCAGTIPFTRRMPVAERAHTARGALDALWAALRYCYPLLLVLMLWELVARAGLGPAVVPADRHHGARAVLGPAGRGRDRGAAAGKSLSRLCRACP